MTTSCTYRLLLTSPILKFFLKKTQSSEQLPPNILKYPRQRNTKCRNPQTKKWKKIGKWKNEDWMILTLPSRHRKFDVAVTSIWPYDAIRTLNWRQKSEGFDG